MNLCNEIITIINQWYDRDEQLTGYKKTVISGVSWYGGLKSSVDSSGLKTANQYIIRVPTKAGIVYLFDSAKARYNYARFDSKETQTIKGNTDLDDAYIDPIAYWKLPNEDAELSFTLAVGDLVVRGEVTEDDSEITPKLIHEKYADVLTVLSVNDNRRMRREPHWKVNGA